MSEFIQSLFVDSQFRNSGTGSDFTIDLPENLSTQPDSVVSLTALSFPVTFWTVEPGLRDQLVFWMRMDDGIDEGYGAVAQLIPGQYDGHNFAEMLEKAMNDTLVGDMYPHFRVLYVATENRLAVYWGTDETPRQWRFISPEQVRKGLPVTWPRVSEPISLARMADRTINLQEQPPVIINEGIYVSGYFDSFGGCHELYLKSSLTAFRNLGPRPTDRDVIGRIPITTDHGTTCHWVANGYSYQWTPVPNLTTRQITFSLTDADGNVVDLHGGNVSFHIIFHVQ